MRILYVALKETLPGTHGGAVHVLEVARQLARRGHALTVLVQQRRGQEAGGGRQSIREPLNFDLVRLPTRANWLLFRLEPQVREWMERVRADVAMERYYNFAGAGVAAAHKAGIPVVLEVNAPMMDPPGTRKQVADRLMFGWMTRRALAQANAACRIVTPLAATVPPSIPREKIREIPWGANVELFDRARLDSQRLDALRRRINPQAKRVVAYLGSFRPWHGVREFVTVAAQIARTRANILFLMIGAGELWDEIRAQVAREHLTEQVTLTGAVNYEEVPYYLALADIGVAPFNTRVHPPLRLGFYWSPLKVHEYMAMELPVVTIDVPGLNQIARHEQEGLLYPEGNLDELRGAILRLVEDTALARRLGAAGRARVIEHFSWQKHGERLEQVLQECVGNK